MTLTIGVAQNFPGQACELAERQRINVYHQLDQQIWDLNLWPLGWQMPNLLDRRRFISVLRVQSQPLIGNSTFISHSGFLEIDYFQDDIIFYKRLQMILPHLF